MKTRIISLVTTLAQVGQAAMTEPRSGTLIIFCCYRFTKESTVSSLPTRGRTDSRGSSVLGGWGGWWDCVSGGRSVQERQ